MINKIHTISIASLVLILSACLSCSRIGDPCLTPKSASLTFKTYIPADTGSAGKLVALPKAVVGLVDTIGFFAEGVESSTFIASLSPVADSMRIYIWPDSVATTAIDTVTFYYQRRLEFISTACGYTYFYNLDRVATTNYNIDSVVIINTEINTDANAEHVKIFY